MLAFLGRVLYTKRNFDDEFIWSKTVTAPQPGAPRLHGRPGQMPKTRRRDGTERRFPSGRFSGWQLLLLY